MLVQNWERDQNPRYNRIFCVVFMKQRGEGFVLSATLQSKKFVIINVGLEKFVINILRKVEHFLQAKSTIVKIRKPFHLNETLELWRYRESQGIKSLIVFARYRVRMLEDLAMRTSKVLLKLTLRPSLVLWELIFVRHIKDGDESG